MNIGREWSVFRGAATRTLATAGGTTRGGSFTSRTSSRVSIAVLPLC